MKKYTMDTLPDIEKQMIASCQCFACIRNIRKFKEGGIDKLYKKTSCFFTPRDFIDHGLGETGYSYVIEVDGFPITCEEE